MAQTKIKVPNIKPPEISITVNDESVRRYVKRFSASRKAMEVSLRTFAQEVYAEIVRRTPGNTIRYQWRIEYKYAQRFLGKVLYEIDIKNNPENNDVLLFLEKGTAPHEIFAINYEWMRFYWPILNKVVYTKHVFHPGIKPYRISEGALQFVEAKAKQTAKSMEDRFDKTQNV